MYASGLLVNAIAVTLGVTAATIYRVLSDDQAKHAGEQNPTSSLWWIRDVKKPCHIDYTAALDLPLIVDSSEHNLSLLRQVGVGAKRS